MGAGQNVASPGKGTQESGLIGCFRKLGAERGKQCGGLSENGRFIEVFKQSRKKREGGTEVSSGGQKIAPSEIRKEGYVGQAPVSLFFAVDEIAEAKGAEQKTQD